MAAAAFGSVLLFAGALLFLRCVLLLAGRGRPRRGTPPAFVLAGPYLRVRNPLLGGAVLALAGLALIAASWRAGVVVFAAGALAADFWVARIEEPRLRARFGEAYVEYLRRVPRWLPALRGQAEAGST